jgi:hypothetical protein
MKEIKYVDVSIKHQYEPAKKYMQKTQQILFIHSSTNHNSKKPRGEFV